ncbi:hypothetical protein PENANT_c077G00285 [Penicillium antarcticum]|uniref:Uncharacterized protein n=1 Tax=Penicillium antarcticum TaxID=416450 RepID=A0A1V6PP72_9EURO|nr:uncharacterized protein N7508_005251 [Penicillium antarcticum]KAJ5306236.1 hypothetical protein N7508_005251 [Penicillium antarcticum]OQD78825.1 hypothetical protein PENANT_c077G00285 [Penicillium antarcticum]
MSTDYKFEGWLGLDPRSADGKMVWGELERNHGKKRTLISKLPIAVFAARIRILYGVDGALRTTLVVLAMKLSASQFALDPKLSEILNSETALASVHKATRAFLVKGSAKNAIRARKSTAQNTGSGPTMVYF